MGDSSMTEKILRTDLTQFAARRRTDGPHADNLDLDILIVGAGFGGSEISEGHY